VGWIDGILRIPEVGIKLARETKFFRSQDIFCVTNQSKRLLHARKIALAAFFTAISLMVLARYFCAYGQDKSGFPDGFDAVQALQIATK
jgi:hypothetical protein